MKKRNSKYIRQIADRLPDVYEQTVSGFYEDYDEEGRTVQYPNIVNHQINHERRLRKAYEQLGMDGIRTYLEMIHNIQIKRNDLLNQQISERQELPVGDTVQVGVPEPDAIGDNTKHPLQDTEGQVGSNRRKTRSSRSRVKKDDKEDK